MFTEINFQLNIKNVKKINIFIIIIVLIIGYEIVIFIRLMGTEVIQDVNAPYKYIRKKATNNLLEDINFSDAKYALYIKHKEFGEFMVTDKDALLENQNALRVKISWVNYLPGEGDRSFGVILFKDKKSVKSTQAGLFKVFEIGTLKNYAIATKSLNFDGVKRDVQNKIMQLKEQENVYIKHHTNLPENDKEFKFQIHFPSVAVKFTKEIDGDGRESIKTVSVANIGSIGEVNYNDWITNKQPIYEKYWEKHLTQCIKGKAEITIDFDIQISASTLTGAYLFRVDKSRGELRSTDQKISSLSDFMFYHFSAYIRANEVNAKKLLALDFSDCMNDYTRNKAVLLSRMDELIQQSTAPKLSVKKGEVGIDGFVDTVKKSNSLYEQEYSISWLELIK